VSQSGVTFFRVTLLNSDLDVLGTEFLSRTIKDCSGS